MLKRLPSGRILSESKRIKTLHFVGISDKETQRILTNAMKASNRWSVLKSADKSDEEIIKSFSVKQNDRIYMERRKGHYYDSMDSIRYYKHFLQSGLMAMEPQTGNIKPG
jgi:penicillin-binding protein 1A